MSWFKEPYQLFDAPTTFVFAKRKTTDPTSIYILYSEDYKITEEVDM